MDVRHEHYVTATDRFLAVGVDELDERALADELALLETIARRLAARP